MNFEWYPGHMEKARRNIEADLKLVDLIIEIIDARIPASSSNPSLNEIVSGKRRLVILNKTDLADPDVTSLWLDYYKKNSTPYLALDSLLKDSGKMVIKAATSACRDKIERDKKRGLRNRRIKAMIIGIPNVGKSTLINTIAGKSTAKTGNKPGVTRGKQWIHAGDSLDLLDTPGVLWPKFSSEKTGEDLAITGAIRNELIPFEELGAILFNWIQENYQGTIEMRYGIKGDYNEFLLRLAEDRGFFRNGEKDTLKAATIFIQEYRTGKLGRISLEKPEEV
jgi:ribosome biogenesis GTPase A